MKKTYKFKKHSVKIKIKPKDSFIQKYFPYVVEVDITSTKDCKSWNYKLFSQNPVSALFKIATVVERLSGKQIGKRNG